MNFITEFWYLCFFIGLILIAFRLYRAYKQKDKGTAGERSVAKILANLNRSEYCVMNDVVLDFKGGTSQIDHLVISDFGMFIIETKNYKGSITGNEQSEYWTQVLPKRENKLYNPIRQNYSHAKALKYNLQEFHHIKYLPIIVFTDEADIKVNTTSIVINSDKLLKVIRAYKEVVIPPKEKDAIIKKIKSVNIRNEYSHSRHVEQVKKKAEEREESIKKGKCPSCGADLILREGEFGKFKGCSNFPKCKFTVGL